MTAPADPKVQAVFLRGHLALLDVGMRPPRGLSRKAILEKATAITGKPYKRGHYKQARNDLGLFIESEDLKDGTKAKG